MLCLSLLIISCFSFPVPCCFPFLSAPLLWFLLLHNICHFPEAFLFPFFPLPFSLPAAPCLFPSSHDLVISVVHSIFSTSPLLHFCLFYDPLLCLSSFHYLHASSSFTSSLLFSDSSFFFVQCFQYHHYHHHLYLHCLN